MINRVQNCEEKIKNKNGGFFLAHNNCALLDDSSIFASFKLIRKR
jgi:hypothetical protein